MSFLWRKTAAEVSSSSVAGSPRSTGRSAITESTPST
jgi:hypothetical protein